MAELTLEFNIATKAVQFGVPTELLKKNIKNIQKQVEKTKKQCLEEVSRIQSDAHMGAAEKLARVKKIIKVVENNQKKLSKALELDHDYRLRLRMRLKRLQELENYTSLTRSGEQVLDLHNEKLISWFVQETNLLVVDYLLKCSGCRAYNIGMKLLDGLGTPAEKFLIDHDIYILYNDIFLAMSDDHNLNPVEAWYNDNKTLLRKINSNLLFQIQYCKYLFLIEQGDIWAAIRYSRNDLACYARPDHYGQGCSDPNFDSNVACLTKIGSPLLSLAITKPPTSQSSWGSLLNENHNHVKLFMQYHHENTEKSWHLLQETFARDFARVYGITQNYPIFVYLSAGLLSLKTKLCYCNEQNTIFETSKNSGSGFEQLLDSTRFRNLALRGPNQYYRILSKINQCPVCSPELFALSRSLPDAQLITHIFDNPFKLPNGNIYPFDKLLMPETDLSLVRHGKVKDPLTQEIFLIDDCVRVFPA